MSASAGNSLPPDITEEILRLLPVKSLGRFKSVSKTWNSLISDPQFIKTHLHQSRKLFMALYPSSLCSIGINELVPYLNSDVITATSKELSFGLPLIQWQEILGSCNGLVLAKDENQAIFLMNPTTREVWMVPDSPFALPDEELNVRYGFGYDSSTDDYKVVSLTFCDLFTAHTDTVVTIYSLRSNTWRRLPDYPCDHDGFRDTIVPLVNQNFHWLVSSSMIVAFSLANEEFSEIKLPNSIRGIYDVVDIGGKLGVYLGIKKACELWVMEEYGAAKSWTRVFSHEFKYPISPVCLVDGSNRDIVLFGFNDLYVFNIDERRCRNVRIVDDPIHFICKGTYVESLESPTRVITTP